MKIKTLLLAASATAMMSVTASAAKVDAEVAFLDGMNAQLAAQGADFRVGMMEYITSADSNQMGHTVFASDHGNKQLSYDFVPGDPRRGGGTDITWAYDTADTTGDMSLALQEAAIRAGQEDWDEENCADLGLTQVGAPADIGVVQAIFGFGGDGNFFYADIQQAGFLPPNFPGFGPNTLGVTFTFGFTSGGSFTDIDNNGRIDAAFRDIYYNDGFTWTNNGGGIDLQTVALHEAGHGLSRAHFGNVSINPRGKIILAPRASMNAIYFGEFRELAGPDEGGHCSDWAQWPQN